MISTSARHRPAVRRCVRACRLQDVHVTEAPHDGRDAARGVCSTHPTAPDDDIDPARHVQERRRQGEHLHASSADNLIATPSRRASRSYRVDPPRAKLLETWRFSCFFGRVPLRPRTAPASTSGIAPRAPAAPQGVLGGVGLVSPYPLPSSPGTEIRSLKLTEVQQKLGWRWL